MFLISFIFLLVFSSSDFFSFVFLFSFLVTLSLSRGYFLEKFLWKLFFINYSEVFFKTKIRKIWNPNQSCFRPCLNFFNELVSRESHFFLPIFHNGVKKIIKYWYFLVWKLFVLFSIFFISNETSFYLALSYFILSHLILSHPLSTFCAVCVCACVHEGLFERKIDVNIEE